MRARPTGRPRRSYGGANCLPRRLCEILEPSAATLKNGRKTVWGRANDAPQDTIFRIVSGAEARHVEPCSLNKTAFGIATSSEVLPAHFLLSAIRRSCPLRPVGQDESGGVIHGGDQVVAAPANHLEVGAIGGPHLVGAGSLVMAPLARSQPCLRTPPPGLRELLGPRVGAVGA